MFISKIVLASFRVLVEWGKCVPAAAVLFSAPGCDSLVEFP